MVTSYSNKTYRVLIINWGLVTITLILTSIPHGVVNRVLSTDTKVIVIRSPRRTRTKNADYSLESTCTYICTYIHIRNLCKAEHVDSMHVHSISPPISPGSRLRATRSMHAVYHKSTSRSQCWMLIQNCESPRHCKTPQNSEESQPVICNLSQHCETSQGCGVP